MDVAALAGVAVALVVASSAQAVTGFGFALLAMPLLSLAVGAKDAVAVSSLVGTLGSMLLLARYRHQVRWGLVRPLLAGAVVGMPLGLYLLVVVDERTLKLAIAATVLVFVGVLASGWKLEGTGRVVDLAAGFVSGVLNTSVSTNGPPLVLSLHARNLDPDVFRGTISAVFAASALVGDALFASAGRYNSTVLLYAAVGPFALVVGNVVGRMAGPHLTVRRFRAAVLGLLVLASCSAVASVIVG